MAKPEIQAATHGVLSQIKKKKVQTLRVASCTLYSNMRTQTCDSDSLCSESDEIPLMTSFATKKKNASF